MEDKKNYFISVAYELYVKDEQGEVMVEETQKEHPFEFITGMGIAQPNFENMVEALATGETFDKTFTAAEAFGEYMEERVREIEREAFSINGHFDHEHIYPDAIIQMQDPEGHVFLARVMEVGDEKVKVDFNHPLAGKALRYHGEIVEKHEASNEEMQQLINQMSHHCGCGCEDCEGECDKEHDGDCGCNHHHDHEHGEGCGCGHHHE